MSFDRSRHDPMRSLGEQPRSHRFDDQGLLVLLLASSGTRREALRHCVWEQAPGCHIQVVDSYLDAMAQAPYLPAHLMVLDMSMDNLLVPAFERFLSRAAPQVTLHVFDDSTESRRESEDVAGALTESASMDALRSVIRAYAESARPDQPGST